MVYPGAAITCARRPFSWITLGGRFGFRQETEDRRIADPYDLDVESRSTEYTAGAVIRPPKIGRVVQLAGFGQLVQSNIVAKSESPLNDDRYDWERPIIAYGES